MSIEDSPVPPSKKTKIENLSINIDFDEYAGDDEETKADKEAEFNRARESFSRMSGLTHLSEAFKPPPMPPVPHHLIRKRLSISQLKTMTEDELMDELDSASNPMDARLITAALLIKRTEPQKPHWTLNPSFLIVAIGTLAALVGVTFAVLAYREMLKQRPVVQSVDVPQDVAKEK